MPKTAQVVLPENDDLNQMIFDFACSANLAEIGGILASHDDNSLVEDSEGNLISAVAAIANDSVFLDDLREEERVFLAEKLIKKIQKSSLSEERHYHLFSGVINMRGSAGENSVAVQVVKLLVENGFDAGAVETKSMNGKVFKKDALEVAAQQSPKFLPGLVRAEEDEGPSILADRAIVKILLKSGKVAGFEGASGIAKCDEIERGVFDFRQLAGREIPERGDFDRIAVPTYFSSMENVAKPSTTVKEPHVEMGCFSFLRFR
ncbi:MAG: hypothetical protein KA100_04675 [Rickettsiales bacterium]|nr:hypothetical protein [Rickettsiales bacterium]